MKGYTQGQIDKRIREINRKRERGEKLTDNDWVWINYEYGGFGCHACPTGMVDRPQINYPNAF